MSFKVLHRSEIDEGAYLSCLALTESRGKATTLYAQPWYLDIVGKGNWSVAIWQMVEGEYDIVLPFVHQRKWEVLPEIFMPFLCQQLGLYGGNTANVSVFLACLFKYWQSRFLRINYSFNTDSFFETEAYLPSRYTCLNRINQEVDCSLSKEAIWKAISETKQKHIRRGERVILSVHDISAEDVIGHFLSGETGKKLDISAAHISVVEQLATAFSVRNNILLYYYTQKESNLPLLGLLQVRFGNRIISLFGGPVTNAKDNYSQDYALWQSMQLIAGLPNAVLDFEGSNLKGVQNYNASFGAVIRRYTHISWSFIGR